uniref:Pyridoxal phosphate-dependent aminotransferase n=1 Tax=Candidatus Desulfatibia profunda TaxID=2841695 RepID=A0A8J6THN5_9BACT|nr:pyridoxal phosphate-dependent aminotransferase [Candidatus Desulfatibia profunda]
MFSDRSNWNLSPNALSLLLQRKKSAGDIVFDLTESNPTRVGLDYDAETILAALAQPQSIVYQPDPRGLEEARQAIAAYYRDRGQRLEIDSILLTASTSEAYSILFKLLGNPKDEILIPRPGYPLLFYLACFESLQSIAYPLRYDVRKGWFIDMDVLPALITPNTKAIVLVNPNNPTGSYVKQQELAALDAVCRRHDLALIVDEVFSDFETAAAPDRVRTAVNRSGALTFVLNGLSKMVGLPQVKLGWIVVGGDPDLAKAALSRLEMMLDFYLSVATPVQHAAQRLLCGCKAIQRQMLARITTNGRFLAERVASDRQQPCAAPGRRLVCDHQDIRRGLRRRPRSATARARQYAGTSGLFLRIQQGGICGRQPVDPG